MGRRGKEKPPIGAFAATGPPRVVPRPTGSRCEGSPIRRRLRTPGYCEGSWKRMINDILTLNPNRTCNWNLA